MFKNDVSHIIAAKRTANKLIAIQDAESFAVLIRKERERADRTQQELSLAVFDCSGKITDDLRSVCESIKNSIRSIDEIGWMGDDRFGVLLPATSVEGARIFAARAAAGRIPYTVFSYPNEWKPEYKEGSGVDRSASGGDSKDAQHSFSIAIPLWKRALDIFGSVVGLTLLWPLFLIIGLYIKIVSPGPVFFKQQRVGQGGKLFTFFKFRTMKYGNDQTTHQQHIVMRIRSGESLEKLDDHDRRIIPGGKLLRRACIDELPQLINVLKGEMSLVGPRPCLPYEAQEFLLWHTHRFDAVPGMTGLWQVSGKNKLTFTRMIRLDISYTENLSLPNDILILLRTVPAIAQMVAEAIVRRIKKDVPITAPRESIREKAVI
jgi:lipopolysaccharide/colanic/teichoic acid biosynthesis glycosyltransferase